MKIRRSVVLTCAGVLAAAGSACAGMGNEQKSDNPTTRQVQESQNQSQQALKQAHDAQQKASDQEKKAAEAQANVQKLQQQLTQAQAQARQEQAKAQQLQQQASQATQEATQNAQSSQEQAAQGLAQANKQAARGRMATHGTVTQATDNQLVVRPQSGQPMTFRVTDQTNVRIDGQPASASDIKQGQDALVSYEAGTLEPNALTVQVVTGNLPSQGTGSSATNPSGSSSSMGTGSSAGDSSGSMGTSGSTGSTGPSSGTGSLPQGTGTGSYDNPGTAPSGPR